MAKIIDAVTMCHEYYAQADMMISPHPMSVKLAVATEKKFLEEEKYRIRLHDLVMGETDRLLASMSDKNFPINIREVSKDALLGRMAAYDAVSEILLGLIIT